MSIAIVTGSAGLVGSEAARFLAGKGLTVVGIDNHMRSYFFGKEADTKWNTALLQRELGKYFRAEEADIRDANAINAIFKRYGRDIQLVIHAAAQPSHDWAAREPFVDFSINANGTMTMLEATRNYCPEASFIFTSTNKVYGDRPNELPLVELDTRWELEQTHPFHAKGIDESMSIDASMHSLFGASKVAADMLVQEYGRYFGLRSACFRGGCLTGPAHSGTQLHGFLSYLVRCAVQNTPYTVFGYKGKQVRDNIHSHDLIEAFWQYHLNPHCGEVYNIGGGMESNVSMLEAIDICEELTGREMQWEYSNKNRQGDHIWYISDISKFKTHYPDFSLQHDIKSIMQDIFEHYSEKS